MKLLHLANHGGRNIGNAALIEGVETLLRTDLPFDLTFVPEPWDLYSRRIRSFDAEFVERVNSLSDGLLVGGAVTFDGSSMYANSGFRLDLPLSLWDAFSKPIVFYGLSYRNWPTWHYHHARALTMALEKLLANPLVLFSVRNDGTKEWLERLTGIRSPRIHVVPDPGMFVATDDSLHPELVNGRKNVIVAPNAEDEMPRYAQPGAKRRLRRPRPSGDVRSFLPFTTAWSWREARAAFVERLARAIARLGSERELNLIFCAHDAFDVAMCDEIFWRLPDRVRQDAVFASALLPNAQGRYFYDLYAKVDLVLGMRIHSMNPAVGLGTPVVPIVSQDRMRAFMLDAGLRGLAVDVHDPDLEAAVHGKAVRALADPEAIRAQLRAATTGLRSRVADFNAVVAAHLAGSEPRAE